MKNDKKLDLMNSTSWKNEFWSHEIPPPDPESINDNLEIWGLEIIRNFFTVHKIYKKILQPIKYKHKIFSSTSEQKTLIDCDAS